MTKSPSVFAATGTLAQINFQGKVVNKTAGTNITDGTYSFTFRIYDVSSGGTHIWSETKNLTVTNGIFQTMLGDTTALPGSVDFNTDNIYLGINFNSDGEMSPRVRFGAVPQALNAQKVAGLTVTDTTGTLTIPNGKTISFADAFTTSGANPITLTSTGTTSITLPTTGTLSTLAGTETLTNKTIGSTGLTFSGASTDITTASNENLTLTSNGSGDIDLNPGGGNILLGDGDTINGGGGTAQAYNFFADTITSVDIADGDSDLFIGDELEVNGAVRFDSSLTVSNGNILGANSAVLDLGSTVTADAYFNTDVLIGSSTESVFNLTMDGNDLFVADDIGAEGIIYTDTAFNVGSVTNTTTLSNGSLDAGTSFSITADDLTITTLTPLGVTLTGDLAVNGDDITSDGALTIQVAGSGTISRLQLGVGGAGSTTPDFLALDVKSDTGDPAGGAEGYLYYNTFDNKFRCYQNSGWTDCIGSGGSVDLDSAYDTDSDKHLTVDSTSGLTFDLTTTGNVVFEDNGTPFFTFDNTGTTVINSGGLTVSSGALALNSDNITSDGTLTIDANGSVVLGGSGNTFTFSETTGPTYAGTARPTKRITLTPEYSGATLTGDGSNNSGTLTADNMTTTPYRNYYNWTTTQGSNQDYDIWVRVPLPQDFSAMAGTPTLSIDTYTTNTTNGTVAVTVYDTSNAADCTGTSFTPSTTTTWETRTATTCLDTGTYTAGGIITIQIKLQAPTSGNTRVGTISLDYLARF